MEKKAVGHAAKQSLFLTIPKETRIYALWLKKKTKNSAEKSFIRAIEIL